MKKLHIYITEEPLGAYSVSPVQAIATTVDMSLTESNLSELVDYAQQHFNS